MEEKKKNSVSQAGQLADKAAAMAVQAAATAMAGGNVALGKAAGYLANKALPAIRKNTEALILATLALIGITATAFLQMLLIAFAVFFVLIPIIMFIINSGAYIVPPSDSIALNQGPVASGSCPLLGTTKITTYAYDPAHEEDTSYDAPQKIGHGSNGYWNAVAPFTGGNKCIFNIPINSMYPGCLAPSQSGSENNVCRKINPPLPNCPYYGYATDVVVVSGNENKTVVLPKLCDQTQSGTCDQLNWTIKSIGDSPNGKYLIAEATGNGHRWTIDLMHIDPTAQVGQQLPSGSIVGKLFNQGSNTHLHIELNVDGIPVKPDFMCGGPGPSENLSGWLIKVPLNKATTLVASTPSEYHSGVTCDWAQTKFEGKTTAFAINANLYNTSTLVPEGPAGFGGQFTQNDSEQYPRSHFYTLYVDRIGAANIFDHGDNPVGLKNMNLTTNDLLAVTGASWDSFPNEARPRTVVGLSKSAGNNYIYFMIINLATPINAYNALLTRGAEQVFMLDSGGSTTLCLIQGATMNALIGNTRNVGNNIGGTDFSITEIK